jgi:hypothetical protein
LDKKEIKQQLVAMLQGGRSKTETFKALSGGAIKDRVLAYWIGAYADPALLERHAGKIKILIVLTCIQALLGLLIGLFVGAMMVPVAAVVLGLIGGAVPLLFAWGFYKNAAQAYTVYVILSISQMPRLFKGYAEDPTSTLIGVAITLAVVFYVAWLKNLLFPDLGFLGSKKVKGQYVFSN